MTAAVTAQPALLAPPGEQRAPTKRAAARAFYDAEIGPQDRRGSSELGALLAGRFGVHEATGRQWVAAFRREDAAGLAAGHEPRAAVAGAAAAAVGSGVVIGAAALELCVVSVVLPILAGVCSLRGLRYAFGLGAADGLAFPAAVRAVTLLLAVELAVVVGMLLDFRDGRRHLEWRWAWAVAHGTLPRRVWRRGRWLGRIVRSTCVTPPKTMRWRCWSGYRLVRRHASAGRRAVCVACRNRGWRRRPSRWCWHSCRNPSSCLTPGRVIGGGAPRLRHRPGDGPRDRAGLVA